MYIIEPRVQCVYNTCSGARETAPDMRPTRMQNSGGSRLPFSRGGDESGKAFETVADATK